MFMISFDGYKKILTFSITILSILGYGFFVFAAQLPDGTPPPTGGYSAGDNSILDPGCAPGSANCVVNPYYVTTASTYNWMGTGAGGSGGSTNNTVFIGVDAGVGASAASYSNFIGTDAGQNAINASNSNFLGQLAGCGATNANDANFFGFRAGCGAINANNANFFGNSSGEDAVNAAYSTYFGDHTGYQATDAAYANFIGANAGRGAYNAFNSNFLGYNAGRNAFNAHDSNFFGYQAGEGADGADNSLFVGNQAGFNFSGTADFLGVTSNPDGFSGGDVFIGSKAGYDAHGAIQATFIGTEAGLNANTALGSVIIGYQAGFNTTVSSVTQPVLAAAIVVGAQAGINTTNTRNFIAMGNSAVRNANRIISSVLIGQSEVAEQANTVLDSIAIGRSTLKDAQNISSSVILGNSAGFHSSNVNNSILIGTNAGSSNLANAQAQITYTNLVGTFEVDESIQGSLSSCYGEIINDTGTVLSVDDLDPCFTPGETITGDDSGATAQVVSITDGTYGIMLGYNANTNSFQNSIALGASAHNTADNQFMIGSSSFPIDEIRVFQTGGSQCVIDGTGLGCTSDERLKTNITDLPTDVLSTLANVRTVSYNWKAKPEGSRMIGFLAQDLEKYFPELVGTDTTGQKSVYYAQITPVLVEAIRELNIKVENIYNFRTSDDQIFKNQLITWFADQANGIEGFFAKAIRAESVTTDQLCVKDICMSRDQLYQLLQNQQGNQGQLESPATPTPAPAPTDTPTEDTTATDTTSTEVNTSQDTPPTDQSNNQQTDVVDTNEVLP